MLSLDEISNNVYQYNFSINGKSEILKIYMKHIDNKWKNPLQFFINEQVMDEPYVSEDLFRECKDYADCGVVIAKQFIKVHDSDIFMNIYNIDYEDYKIISDMVLDKNTLEFQKEFEDTPNALTLSANLHKDVIRTEFFVIEEKDVDNLKLLINEENIDAICELYNLSDDIYEFFNLYGDDDNEIVSYEIEDKDNEIIDEGTHLIREIDAFNYRDDKPLFGEHYSPKYLLVHTDLIKRSSATFSVPASFNIDNLRFQTIKINSIIDDLTNNDMFGDTIISLSDAYFNGTLLEAIDFCDGGSWGDDHFWLYELDNDRKYKLCCQC